MRSYLSYVPIAAKSHRKQNRMTLVCISTAVFLVTAIFSMTDRLVRTELAGLTAKHGEAEVEAFLRRQAVVSTYPIALILFLFVLIAGSLMISGILSGNVSQRIRFFGNLRCIGMSKKQIMRLVRLEALNWCKTAIPVGVAAGIVSTWGLCAVMKYAVAGEFAEISVWEISIPGMASGIAMGVLTVLIAAGKPARMAAKVTPVAALSGSETEAKSLPAFTGRLPIEYRLGVGHAFSDRRRLGLQTASIAFAILLVLSFSVILRLVACLMPQSASREDLLICGLEEAKNSIPFETAERIGEKDGVKEVFARRCCFEIPCKIEGREEIGEVDLISYTYASFLCDRKDGIIPKNADLDLFTGDHGAALVISDSAFEIGEEIRLLGGCVTVAGQCAYDPFSSNGLSDGKTTLLVADETYTRLTGTKGYARIGVQLFKNAPEETVEEIRQMVSETGEFTDEREDDNRGTYVVFAGCMYGFLLLIAFVAVMNIVNSLSLGVQARMKQYGAMRAVGMDEGQLIRMIGAESAVYAFSGLLAGLLAGLPLYRRLYTYLLISHFPYVRFQFPFTELMVIVLSVLAATALGTGIPGRMIRRMSVTETIGEL